MGEGCKGMSGWVDGWVGASQAGRMPASGACATQAAARATQHAQRAQQALAHRAQQRQQQLIRARVQAQRLFQDGDLLLSGAAGAAPPRRPQPESLVLHRAWWGHTISYDERLCTEVCISTAVLCGMGYCAV